MGELLPGALAAHALAVLAAARAVRPRAVAVGAARVLPELRLLVPAAALLLVVVVLPLRHGSFLLRCVWGQERFSDSNAHSITNLAICQGRGKGSIF